MSEPTSTQGRLAGLSREQRALLFEQIRKRKEGAGAPAGIPRRPPDLDPVPASFAQERLWFMDRLAPGNAVYNIPMALRVEGEVAPAVLEAVLGEVVHRHEALRTTFREAGGQPVQVIAPPSRWNLPLVDLSVLPEDLREAEARRLALEDSIRTFDLEAGPLLHATLLRLGPAAGVLLLNMHHIVSDGWSMGVLVREITALYGAAVSGRSSPGSPLPELPLQYADFAVWQRGWLREEVLERQLAYWRERLAGAPPSLDLPADRPRPAVPTYRGARLHTTLGRDLKEGLVQLARRHEASLYMVLLAGFQALLSRLTGQKDLSVGSPIANRHRPEIEPLIGFFVNSLVMRSDLNGDPSFRELLAQARKATLEAFANQDLPFERLVKELQPERHLSMTPLFQAVLALQNAPVDHLDLPGLSLSTLELEATTAESDLELHVWEREDSLLVVLAYSTELFDAPTILRIAGHLETLLRGALADPGRRLSELPLLSEPERAQLLREWNDTRADRDDAPLHRLVEAWAAAQPDALAVLSAAGERLTYGELDARAGRLARRLRDDFGVGAGPESRVVIAASRSPELVVGMLAVLKAGGAYVPIDPRYPAERVSCILEDSGALARLGDNDLSDGPGPTLAGEEADPANPESAAYIIYTSGSTGIPKGVVVSHRSISRYVRAIAETYRLAPGDRALQFASIGFDMSVEEIWCPLASGATLVLRSEEAVGSIPSFLDEVERLGITLLNLTTAYWHELAAALGEGGLSLPALPASVRLVVIGGEEAQPHRLASWFRAVRRQDRRVELLNSYGPTETTVCATISNFQGWNEGMPVPIGRPREGTWAYGVDRGLRLVPIGVWGELLIGGEGVARGYLNRPDLTAERFVPDPWSGEPGARAYRSGDLVRFRPDGELLFGGRIDQQVKIRGFRIEPGEIESALLRHPQVREAVVEPRKGAGGGHRLVAWVVHRPEPAEVSADKHEIVAQWQALYDESYIRDESADTTFDIEGWNSSYTGQAIPAVEMREWVERTVERILSLKPRRPWRILEIGCGTGLLLFRVAPATERYLGTDFSGFALEGIRRLLARGGLPQVELRQAEADDWKTIAPGEADLVILNSVSQYFPDADYLARVLEGAVRTVAPGGGSVFVGDVRSLPLLEAFATSVERFQSPGLSPEELKRRVLRRVMEEEELVVDPAFFFALARRLPVVRRVSVLLKRGRWHNELTRFRYDVVLHTGEAEAAPLPLVDGRGFSLGDVERLLGPRAVAIGGLVDARVTEDGVRSEGIDPEDLWELAERRGYDAELSVDPDAPGRFRAVLKRQGSTEVFTVPAPDVPDLPWSAFANDPLRSRLAHRLGAELRRALQAELPDYMVPAAFVVLDALPLTPNGKVDRAALPDPEPPRSAASTPPGTPAEQELAALWKDVLGIEEVGLEDNFFELGGHSLLATQLVSRVSTSLGVDLPLRTIFEHPTLGALADVLETRLGVDEEAPPSPSGIVPQGLTEAPLSFAQERLWFIDRLERGTAAYNVPLALAVHGALSPAALEAALGEILRRHGALRTTFSMRGAVPLQAVSPPGPWSLPWVDLSTLPAPARDEEILRLAVEDGRWPFDLERGPLLRALLLRSDVSEHTLLLAMHHIVSDGWSMGVLVKEIVPLYQAALAGGRSPLPELNVQYTDFAVWQRRWLQGEVLEEQIGYWRERLRGAPAALELPMDRPRPAAQSYRGAKLHFALGSGRAHLLGDRIRDFALRHEATPFMVLLAVFQALLRRYTGQDDVVIGSAIANRNHAGTAPLIGFFVNTLVLRTRVPGDPAFARLLADVRETALGAYAHQDLPFERLVEELQPERSLGKNPLFQVMFVLQNAPLGEIGIPEIRLSPIDTGLSFARFDLTLTFEEEDGRMLGEIEYSTDLFERPTMERLAGHYQILLAAALEAPGRYLSELPLLSGPECAQLLREWNDTRREDLDDVPLHRLVEARAQAQPDALAVLSAAGAAGESLTYGELDARAGRLARRLRDDFGVGVGPESRVAITASRSPGLIVGMLAVLKAGGAYVPIDPDYPAERVSQILEDSGALMLLGDLGGDDLADRPGPVLAGEPSDPANPAYVIYTSGSTGRPKGVVVSHRAASWHIRNAVETYGLNPGDRALQFASLGFDFSVEEIWGALAAGATLVLRSREAAGSLSGFLGEVDRLGVTVMSLPTAFWHELATALGEDLRALPPALRLVVIGGEEVKSHALASWRRRAGGVRLLSIYGPTEVTVCSHRSSLERWGEGEPPPLGQPIEGARSFAVDAGLALVPAGVWGELLIGGEGVARGYLNRPDLTAERFVPDAWSGEPGARVYRSGDRVRFRPDGELQFGGRIDHQVKIRGFRIEPGEIENALLRHPRVREAVVEPRKGVGGGRQLVAWVVPRPEPAAAADNHEHVAQWRTLYDDTYTRATADAAADATFDVEGWNSSYTGQPIPAAEMREWVERTVERILALKPRRPRRILEIGCGTGLLLFRVAPAAERYLGTDFSHVVLEGIRRLLAGDGLPQAELLQAEADDWGKVWSSMTPGEADLVILNSVSQYFPDADYLARVLDGAVRTVAPAGGSIFIGDVRSLPLLEAFATSVERFQAPDLPAEELRRRVRRRMMDEEELVVDPAFFFALARRLPAVRRVSVLLKRGRWHNELTRFRYDVVLHTGETAAVPLSLVDGSGFSLEDVERLLGPRALAIAGLVDARVTEDGTGIDPEDLWELAERRGYDAELSVDPDSPGRFRALLKRQGSADAFTVPAPDVPDLPWSAFTNNPLRSRRSQLLGSELRRALQAELPDYMVPAAFVVLDALPLTPNGKVDRAALPDPEPPRSVAATPPRTPAEQALAALWKDVLGIEEVGLEDNFFDLGGHSLLATQLVSRVRSTFGIDLPLRRLFERQTLRELAAALPPLARETVATVPRRPSELDPVPASFAQERLWLLDRLQPGNPAYNIPTALRVLGELSPTLLEAVLGEVVRRHEALRTTFEERDGRPVQVVASPGVWTLPVIDLAGFPGEVRREEARRLAVQEAVYPFDLARGPLLRTSLLRLEADDHGLLLTMHHIVSDGWSMGVLVREMTALYEAALAGRPSPLPDLPIQYADFAVWQRGWLAGGERGRQLAYWRAQLDGLPESLELPVDRPRPAFRTHRGNRVLSVLGAGFAGELTSFARRHDLTPFMALLATFQALLGRLAGREDIPLGTPIANRNRAEIEPLIGFFVNTLVLRGDLTADPSFGELLARVRRTTLDAYAHQDLPFEILVEELRPRRHLSMNPLFQVMFALQNTPRESRDLPGLSLAPLELEGAVAQFDLDLNVWEAEGSLALDLTYSTELFDGPTIRRMAGSLETLLRGAMTDPHRRLSDLPLLGEGERHQLLVEWNPGNPRTASDGRRCLHRLFEEQVDRTPDAVAVSSGSDRFTYRELDEWANRLARRLQARGAGPGTRVALKLDRSAGLVAAILAVLKTGAAYVPLDPEYPAERLAFVLEDSGAALVMEEGDLSREGERADRLELPVDPDLPAYVIYTSGSTGLPKGVVVTHANVDRLFTATEPWFGFGPDDVWTLFHSYAFDFSVWELWGALLHGGRLVVVPYWESRDPEAFYRRLRDERVTVLNQTPSAFRQLVVAEEAVLGGAAPDLALRWVIFGGEALEPASLAPWFARHGDEQPRLVNMYGITETTVHVTFRLLKADDLGRGSVLGQPIPDLAVHVLDSTLRPQPIGVPGEIHVGGAGLAQGYLARPDLTAERFVPDPFSVEPGARLYRSGDLARRLPDGDLEYLGRIDHQVKIRGFRIELGEIESVLTTHPGVRDVAVVARRTPGGDASLLACVVLVETDVAGLRAFLAERLPAHMVPSAFAVLPRLPLTPNGKVDRRALEQVQPEGAPDTAFAPPRTPVEEELAGIWRQLLGVEKVGRLDNFFELGGHSLLATQLVSRVRASLGADLPLRTLFERPTLEGLAEAVEEQRGAEVSESLHERVARLSPEERARVADQLRQRRASSKRIPRRAPDSGPVPASLAQERLWFMDRLAPGNSVFNMPSPLRLRGPLDPEVLERSFREVFRRHESLRTRFEERDGAPVQVVSPPGPWFLPRVDLRALPADAGGHEAERLAAEEGGWPFDLSRGPLLRAVLLRLAQEDHALLMTCHHIVSDGWSMGVLVNELTACYQAFATGRPSPLPELPIQYADYAAWQRARLAGGGLEEQIGYWREQLAGAPAHLDLPLDRPRPAVQTYRGASILRAFPRDLSGRLQALSVAESVSLFMTLLAGLKVVLHRWSGQDDLVVGTPMAGRERPETEGLIGYFLNLLALRTGLSGDPGFRELLRRVRESALGAYSHQTVPFERLLSELEVERDLSRSPVFQVLFNMLNLPAAGGTLPGGLVVEYFDALATEAKYDFTLYAQEGPDGIWFNLVYNPDLFDPGRMEELLLQLRIVLEQIARDPDRSVESLSLVTPEAAAWLPDPARLLEPEWSGSVHERFLAHARSHPDRIAAVDTSGVWTWGDLDAASGNLAARVHPGETVAVWAHRAAPLAAALLGVLRAGAAFVILDPAYPPARLAAVVKRARPQAWIDVPGAPPVPPEVADVLSDVPRLGMEGPGVPADPDAPCVAVHPDAPAWIAFTSGSTGEPKGIVGSHRPLSHFLDWHARTFGLGEDDRFSLLSGLAHDPLLRDVFTPLWVGGSLHVPDPEQMAEPGWLAGWLRREEVTVAHLTPALGRLLEDGCAVPSLRLVCSGGEALTGEDVARLRRAAPGAVLVNFYGATETPQAMGWKVVEGTPDRVPLGRGIEGVDLLVLGPSGELAGTGELGEICIRTPYLALGYLEDPAGTAERFAPAPGGRLYRTGDLGRYEPGGDMTYAGRADRQLKIRGFRVEPGEIEAAINRLESVRDSVVVADGESNLVAYVVPEPGASGLAGRLRPFLASRLPGYMVPAAFVELPALPLTPNGKVDRRALPAPSLGPVAGEGPRTPLEETLAGIWAALLRRPRIGLHESFFDLGGHSLLATQMVARVRAALGIELPLRALFDHPTLAGLAARIEAVWRTQATGLPEPPPLRPVPRDQPQPLSFAQERLWFLAQIAPESAAYGMPAAVRLIGDLDREALAATLSEIRRRHETLRTTFGSTGGEPIQVIHPPEPLPLPLADLSALPAEVREAEAYRLAEELGRTPYDLAQGPLVRARLLRLAADEHALLWNTHHIVSDAWSVGVLVRELAALYAAFAQGRPSPLPELPLQYGDYAAWQRDWLRGPALDEQIGYWRKRLAGASPLDLPTDRPRPAVPSTRGASRTWTLPGETTEALRRLALAEGATLFMALHAGFSALLHLYTGRTDVAVGSPVANRSRAELEGLIGFFINTLVLRTDLAGDPGFRELIARSREMALGAWAHQDLPFEKLVDELGLPRDPFRQPLLRVVLQLRNVPLDDGGVDLPGLTLAPFELEVETAKFDLVLNFAEGADALYGEIRYDTDLFDPATIERLAGHLGHLLTTWGADPDRRLAEMTVLSRAERHQLLVEWNPGMAAEGRRCLHRLFEEQVDRTPDAIAISGGLTYRELDEWANRLARRLLSRGAGPGRRVALKLDRSAGLVAAILAVLKTGAAYVPLDPAYPAERLAFVLEDSGAALVMEEGDLSVERESAERLDLPVDSDFPAYVIYTSGSTGRPKGVVVTHANVDRLFTATAPWFGFGPDDVWTLFHSYAFDFSVWELWGALLHGGRLVVVPYWESRDPEAFYRRLRDERVTVLNQTPSAFRQLLWAAEAVLGDASPDLSLRWVIFGGEALEPASLAPWFARHGDETPRLVNMYGITETTVHVTFRPLRADDLGRGSVLGQPIPDLAVHILDSTLRPQPIGVPGEIHVGGAGLAQGYLGRPDLTAERFVPDPFSDEPGARLYRSGDLARRLPDGDLEYLGRIDHQVKIRGFRIELGEIEAALAVQPGVREAVVLAREDRLVAYVVGETREPAVLREALAQRLPDHMLPSAFVFLDALPLTENGKVDRRALPDPNAAPEAAGRQRHEPPRTDLERFLVSQFRDVLGLGEREVGLHDDFFELGGTSITGAIFIHRLQEALSEIVHVVTIFDHPTVASLADYIREQHAGAARRLWNEGDGGTGGVLEIVGPAEVEEMDRLIAAGRPAALEEREPENPPAVFVLAPPRSGTTLLRVMLGAHPALFAPPELELLSFQTLAERSAAFQGRDSFWLEGLVRAVMEARDVDAAEAEGIIAGWESQGWTTRRAIRQLQEWLGDRVLVDKTPSYALDPEVLRRAEEGFAGARYLHLTRHPQATNRSFEEAKLDQIFFRRPHPFSRRQLAELVWTVSHRNIQDFLASVPRERWMTVRFEDLVREPDRVLAGIAGFLGLPYQPEMAEPYREGVARMVGGPHEVSRMLGDVKFLGYGRVDPAAAERWRAAGEQPLGEPAREVARNLGYLDSVLVPLQTGSPDRRPLFCVHPVGGEVVAYRELARRLPGQPVYGLQSPAPPIDDLREMAARYLNALREVQPEGPYRLAGWSMGGVVAYEMARQLAEKGEQVDFLALIDTAPPDRWAGEPEPTETEMVALFASDLASLHGLGIPDVDLTGLDGDGALALVLDLGRQAGLLPPSTELTELRRLFDRFRTNRRALSSYTPLPYAGDVTLFLAQARGEDRATGWSRLVPGNLEVFRLPGDHYTLLREEVEALASLLRTQLPIAH